MCATHCEQRLQPREPKTLTKTSQDITRSAHVCPSLARVAFKLCVVIKWSGYVQQGTGVQLLTVEQECLLLGTDVKHSGVQNLFSLPNEVSFVQKKFHPKLFIQIGFIQHKSGGEGGVGAGVSFVNKSCEVFSFLGGRTPEPNFVSTFFCSQASDVKPNNAVQSQIWGSDFRFGGSDLGWWGAGVVECFVRVPGVLVFSAILG